MKTRPSWLSQKMAKTTTMLSMKTMTTKWTAMATPILNWSEATEAVDTAKSILMVTHLNPDGDAIGSLLGAANALRARGCAVTTLAVDKGVPTYLKFIPGTEGIVPKLESGEWELMISL